MGIVLYWEISSTLFNSTSAVDHNEMIDLWSLGAGILFCIICVVNLKLLMASTTHNIFSEIFVLTSIASFLIMLYIVSQYRNFEAYSIFDVILSNHSFLITVTLMIASCILCEYAWRSLHFIIEELMIKAKIIKNRQNTLFAKFKQKKKKKVINEEEKKTHINDTPHSLNNINRIGENIPFDERSEISESERSVVSYIPSSIKDDPEQKTIINKNRRCKIIKYKIL
jgi:hypothetical protein